MIFFYNISMYIYIVILIYLILGTFGICLDNRNSRFMTKNVQVSPNASVDNPYSTYILIHYKPLISTFSCIVSLLIIITSSQHSWNKTYRFIPFDGRSTVVISQLLRILLRHACI